MYVIFGVGYLHVSNPSQSKQKLFCFSYFACFLEYLESNAFPSNLLWFLLKYLQDSDIYILFPMYNLLRTANKKLSIRYGKS